MSAFDSNRDGRFNLQEVRDQVEFRYADRDDDGVLNRKEFAHVEGKLKTRDNSERLVNTTIVVDAKKFDRYDTNRDALVDPREYARGEAEERNGKKSRIILKNRFQRFLCLIHCSTSMNKSQLKP